MGQALPVDRPTQRTVHTAFIPAIPQSQLNAEERKHPNIRTASQELDMRRDELQVQKIALLAEHMKRCARKEGAFNAQQNCRHLALQYMHLIRAMNELPNRRAVGALVSAKPLPPLSNYYNTHEMESDNPIFKVGAGAEASTATAAAAHH